MNIVCFGSSITEAAGVAEGDRWPTVLQFKLECWKPGEYKVYNRGIGGNTTANLFDRFDATIPPLLPGIVLLQIGGNDSGAPGWADKPRVSLEEYRLNLANIYKAIVARRGRVIFSTYHTMKDSPRQGNGKTRIENYKPYAVVMRELAAKTGSCLIDLHREMKERGITPDDMTIEDGVHLTPRGNHLYADMVYDGLKRILV